MTILLKKDGRLIIDADQPIEGVSLDNLAAILSGANDGDVIKYDATNGMWVSGAGGSSLPSVTASDNGDVLTVVNGAWAKATPSSGGGVLVVNITNGTSNKTWQEIWDAYASGSGCKFVENFGEYTNAEWYLTTVEEASGTYKVELFTVDIHDSPVSILPATLSCDSASGYPTGSLG